MDALHLSNSLSTVQVIPIFQYLSIISDFLFLENYLPEVDQYKPIPVVNELYRYFEENRANQNKTLLLIRNLLKGSDLYGEQENETPDEIFITTLFDYIISSLVFAKYGNIYGFLAESVRQVDNLKFDSILERIEENLQNAIFENEYGDGSMLTQLSGSRIFREIILPLFPQPLFSMNILSFDYFYALAGSTYLRLGNLNETYYSNLNSEKTINRISFDEYVSIGYVIEELYNQEIDLVALKAFALPALFYYVSIKRENYDDKITNVIFNPQHWEKAYSVFFEYLKSTSKEIETQLENDYTYKIHRAFSNFVSRAKYAKLVLDYQCRHLNDFQRESKIDIYIENAEYYKCRGGDFLPNINDWFMEQIDAFGELYKKYDYGMMQEIFNESSIDLRDIAVNLIVTNDKVENEDFSTSQHLSYDLLEFQNMIANTMEYYAIVRENYTVKLVKESDDQEYFQQLIGPSKNSFIHSSERILLKDTYQSPETLCQVITDYKKKRFLSYLTYSDNSPEKSKWWREFGFSFVPLYPCVSDINHYGELSIKLCEQENIDFLNKHPEIMSTDLISNSTQIMLSSFGTSIESVFLKSYLHSSVESLKKSRPKTIKFQKPTDEFYKKLSLQLGEPKYEIMWFTDNQIRFIMEILDDSSGKIKKTFKYAKNALYKLFLLKGTFIIDINSHASNDELHKSVFIRSLNGVTGHGYKFTLADNIDDQTPSASLITGYKFNELENYDLSLLDTLSKTIPIIFKNKQIKCNADKVICKTTNASTNAIEISFQGIWSDYRNDDGCVIVKYLQGKINSSICLRQKNYLQKLMNDATIFKAILKNTANKGPELEEQVRSILKWYVFPNQNASIYFITNWIKDKQFENSDWSQDNVIDTTGVLNLLLYNKTLDNRFMTKSEAESKINATYTYRERSKIEEEKSIENILENYQLQREDFFVTFDDYYAIRNFITTGYERIMSDTQEAKLMKLALYRLALRQSIDFDDKNEMKLYIFESVREDIFRKKFMKDNSEIADLGKDITLQKFLLTIESEKNALRFTKSPSVGFRNILYEINFSSFYLRGIVDVEVRKNTREKRIIILPGNKFHLENMFPVQTARLGTYFKVVLTSKSKDISKYEQFKNVMKQMEEIDLLKI